MVKKPLFSGISIKGCDMLDTSLIHTLGSRSPMMVSSGGSLREVYCGLGFFTMVLKTRRPLGSNVRRRSPRALASW